MFKVIYKTALKALLAVIIALVLAFGVASLAFPQSMASMCEKLGNYSGAVSYASLRYTYTKNVDDLARCADDSILAKSDGKIVKYCGKLVEHEDFDEVCKKKSTELLDYRQSVYGNLSAAQYRKGETQTAIQTAVKAMEGVNGFPKNNAFVFLTLEVQKKADKDTAVLILEEIKNYEDQSVTYNAVKNVLTNLTA